AEAAVLLEKAAKLGHVAAAYNLALLYLEGQQVAQNLPRAAELLRAAADTGSPEAQYALATLYKEGSGVPKDPVAAAKLLGAAARSGNLEAQVEYARSEEHTSELQSRGHLVCRLLLEKKNNRKMKESRCG